MQRKEFPKEKMSFYRKLFSNEVKSEIDKFTNLNKKRYTKATEKYLDQINKLLLELRDHKIADKDLVSNKIIFRRLKREHAFLRNRLWAIIFGIVILALIITIILLAILL
ncbi:hypothetical protein ACNQ17_02785 [Mycoplasma sp. Sp48II]|uniref:hypothetical protein n=1 Tax=unclassified Mycoplasma TaxID=2683645 RepID=UPI003A849C8F